MTMLTTADVTPRRGGTRSDLGSGQHLLATGARLARSGPADHEPVVSPEGLHAHLARLGSRPVGTPALHDRLEREGLTGHGGGHVPTALKWRSALRRAGALTVVANGAESEPLSAKDGTLLRQRPHLVLDGLALAAEALGARRAVVWLHGDDDGARRALESALVERRAAQTVEPPMELVLGPVHYLSGEATAIGQALDGGPTLPRSRRPPAAADEPVPRTLVQNVETLARVALIARDLADPPVALLTLVGAWGRRVLEVPRATTFHEVLTAGEDIAVASGRAVLLGGFGGTWVLSSEVGGLPVDEPALRAVGLSLGAGVVAPLPAGACGLREAAALAHYLARMSARQCGPCLFGLPALAHGLSRLAEASAGGWERARIASDLDAVAGRGACHHPDGATRMIASALAVFGDDVDRHARGRPCAGPRAAYLSVPGAAP